MQVSVEKINDVERRLTIIVPKEKYEEAYNKEINQYAQKASIKGFRPGKAPISLITKFYGDDARREALTQVIQHALYQAMQEQNLNPISTPRIEPKATEPHQPLEFSALFEVLPEIAQIQFKMDTIEKLKVDIDKEDINQVIEQIKKQYTKWNTIEREVKEKDRVIIDYYAIFEGKTDEANKVDNFPLEIGSKVMLPGFEEGLLGVKKGDEKTIHLKFPEDFALAERRGKEVDFVVTIKDVLEAQVPELNNHFIQSVGIKSGSEDDLVNHIGQILKNERDRLILEKMKEKVFDELILQNKIEIPNSLIAREAKNIHDQIYPNEHNHKEHSEDEMKTFREVAKKRVALGLLITEYAKQNHIEMNKEQVKKRIEEIAAVYENPQEVIAWLSSDNERRTGIEAQVVEDQVLEKLIEGIPATEKTMTYAELKSYSSK